MTCIKKYNNIRITPMYALLSAYIFLCIIIIYFSSLKYLSNNSYFKWGPPIKVFQIKINDNMSFYILLFIYFVNEIINSLLSAVVYSWIINCVQDPKSKNTFYSKKTSLILIVLFTFYSQLNLIFVINGSFSQISIFVATLSGGLITSVYINWNYIERIHRNNDVTSRLIDNAIMV